MHAMLEMLVQREHKIEGLLREGGVRSSLARIL